MPFTFAHPAAVLPLTKIFGRYGNFSALVIGSISPDMAYIIPMNVARYESHSFMGLFWFCLPVGLAVYIAYHSFLKNPLLSLAPERLFFRLSSYAPRSHLSSPAPLSWAAWLSVVGCLLVGAITHLVWDAFTHANGFGVTSLPVLKTMLFSIGSYPIYFYKILQHVSTLGGLSILCWSTYKWFICAPFNLADACNRTAPFIRTTASPRTLPIQRFPALIGITTIPMLTGLWFGAHNIGTNDWPYELQAFAGRAVFSALPTFALTLVLYSAWWHLNRTYSRTN